MRHVHIDSVEPGQVLGKSIYSSEGLTLLQSGISLTPGMINTLRRIGVTMIYILEEEFEDITMEDVVSDETRRQAIAAVAEAMQSAQKGKELESKSLQKSVNQIIDEILRNKHILLNLTDIRTQDNHLFIHSINVCIMSTVIGVHLDFNLTQLRELSMGALLHDLGKVAGNRENEKSEEEHHGWIGFNLLRKKHEFSLASAHIALQHHERVDGTGQPRGISGDHIHVYAKITAVANYYDNLISDFSANPTYLPYEANEQIMGLAGVWFDHDIVHTFLRAIALYPTGTSVKLSTGDTGVVVGQHKGLPARPIVRVIKKEHSRDAFASQHHEVKEIDLAKETTIFITHVLKN